MPVVFVHGVPETPAIWTPLVEALGLDDAVLLQLPGFGCPVPSDFEPTMQQLASWLAAELDSLGASSSTPIDLVAHDWGALLAIPVLSGGPDRVRSLVTDGGHLHDDFQWHDMAKLWQTPGEGEAFMDTFVGASDDERAAMLVGSGVPDHAAPAMAAEIDRTMADSILTLYRSATAIGPEWGPHLDEIDVPALVIDAAADAFRRDGEVTRLAERLGAATHRFDAQGHWWMLGDPAAAASAIAEFWSTLDG